MIGAAFIDAININHRSSSICFTRFHWKKVGYSEKRMLLLKYRRAFLGSLSSVKLLVMRFAPMRSALNRCGIQ